MSEVTITFDVDGTLAYDLDRICELIRRDYGVEFHPEHVTEWNADVPEVDAPISELMGEYRGTGEFLPLLEPIEPACELLRDLAARPNVTINIATHRPESASAATREWLDAHNLNFNEFYCGRDIDKGRVAGDVLIDDKPSNVTGAAEDYDVFSILVLRHSNISNLEYLDTIHSASDYLDKTPTEIVHGDESDQWAAIREILNDHVF